MRLRAWGVLLASLLLWVSAWGADRPAQVGDMAERVLPCTACHGKEGRATPDGYFPRIAGKPAGYLYNQLRNFHDGRRSYPQMAYLLTNLSDGYLYEMAQYFAALRLPYAEPPPPAVPRAVLDRGQALVRQGDASREVPACVQCHGERLTGAEPFIPSLLGVSRDYLVSQLGAWRTGQRHAQAPDCMAEIANRLTLTDVQAVAAWLATQSPVAGGEPAAAAPARMPLRCGSLDVSLPSPSVKTGQP